MAWVRIWTFGCWELRHELELPMVMAATVVVVAVASMEYGRQIEVLE